MKGSCFNSFFLKGLSSSSGGQLSLFAALIFQVLFILFAMSLNISLVVHDKINLQNSLDLAAYYGAMKQAEQLNAIAHINYQIRQSWKLLAWRYRVLGNLGGQPSYALPQGQEEIAYDPKNRNPGVYSMCVGHKLWGKFYQVNGGAFLTATDQNLCLNITGIPISPLKISSGGVVEGLSNLFNRQIPDTIRNFNQVISNKCKAMGFNSWLMAFNILLNFRKDNSIRQYMIYKLAKNLSEGKDLDGKDILEGVRKTFEKNLTFRNLKSFKHENMEARNSLQGREPKTWLRVPHNPHYYMLYTDAIGSNGCLKGFKLVDTVPEAMRDHIGEITQMIKQIITISENLYLCKTPGADCNPTAGVYKNPDMDISYGLTVAFDYTGQIFSPLTGPVKFQAQAKAKPFGGRIGPPAGADKIILTNREIGDLMKKPEHCSETQSSQGSISSSITTYGCNPQLYSNYLGPNYSRFPGDTLGLRSKSVQSFWLQYLLRHPNAANKNLKDVNHYFDRETHAQTIINPLARKPANANFNPDTLQARGWELAAVSPDLFDITYYSIFPSYMHTYYDKVKKIVGEEIPGDLGYSFNGSQNNLNHLRYQIHREHGGVWRRLGLNEPPFYKINKPSQLLTGWTPPRRKYFAENSSIYFPPHRVSGWQNIHFGNCLHWDSGRDSFWPGNRGPRENALLNGCIFGGRTGYSVKLVNN